MNKLLILILVLYITSCSYLKQNNIHLSFNFKQCKVGLVYYIEVNIPTKNTNICEWYDSSIDINNTITDDYGK